MKKFRLEAVKTQPPVQKAKPTSKSNIPSKQQTEKEAKRSKIQKEIALLNSKISSTNTNITETKKMLDIDLFLKKEKDKRLEYSKKLNSQYEHDKQQREKKLYKQNNRDERTSKLSTNVIKSEVPLNIFGALDQISKADNVLKKWILADHHHRLDEMILDKTKNEQLFGEAMKNAEEELLKGNSENAWKRAKEVTNNSSEMKYFPVKIEESQLESSDFGEALMSVLTLMPESLSQHLYHEYADVNRQQYFMLRFFAGGQKKTILTNEWLQTREFVHKMINVSSRSKDNLVFWSSILQKGFKKLFFKQYQPSLLSQMFQIVYGIDPEFITFSNKNIIRDNFHKIIETLSKQQPRALVGFINDRADTHQRIYPLLGVHLPVPPVSTKHKKGKNNKMKEEEPENTDILYHISNPYAGTILSSTFVNKFTLNQLFQKFTKIVILRELPYKWTGIRVFVEFLSNGPISFTGSSWTQNNQYSFTITKTAQMRLALRRRWGCYIDPSQKEEDNIFGYMLFRSQQGETEISCLKLQALVHKGKSTDSGGCVLDIKLEKGTYIFLPYSHSVSQQYMQLFNLDLLIEREDILSLNKSRMNDYYYHEQGSSGDKVSQKLQSKVKYEKSKSEKISISKLMFQDKNSNITSSFIEKLGLTLNKDVSCEDYFLPGKLKHLLTTGEEKESKKGKTGKKSAQNEEVQQFEKEEALKIILGYDILMGEDINQGEMKNIIEETADQVDLANFGLGQEGLMAMMEPLMLMPRIAKLDLSHNNLNDSAVTYLCYYLQKGNRKELRELNLQGNPIGKNGLKALKGLSGVCQELKILGVKI